MLDEELIMSVASGSTDTPISRSPNCGVASGLSESQTTPPGIEQICYNFLLDVDVQRSATQSGSSSASTIPLWPWEIIEECLATMSMLVMDDVEEALMLLPC